MLQALRIRNLAIVDDVQVGFENGLNVITGETGAGKSLLVGALNLVLGDRADKALIRTGADSCAVEATFHLASATEINSLLDELGLAPCDNGQLIIRRQFTVAGTSKCLINDSSTTVQALKRVGDLLVDMHGPHDHQSLLSREFQLDLLDSFGQLGKQRTAYEEAYRHWLDLQNQRAALNSDGGDVTQHIDFLRFQIKEIEAAKLEGMDENELIAEHTRVANAQRILELAEAVRNALSEDDSSAFQALAAAQKHLSELEKIVPEAETWKQDAANATGQLQELARAVSDFAQKIDADPARMQALEEQMSTLHRLKRKYGGGVKEILAFLAQSKQRLNDLETRGERAEKLDAEIKVATAAVGQRGRELSTQRKSASKKLGAAITKELRALGFPHGSFDVTLTESEPGPGGIDAIEFGFAPNVGEPTRPLRAIASSGEISRVMLAVKVVLAAHDRIPVLVFDEVDANVGGEMGNAIGEKLRSVADKRQVLCITHLPQVAAQGGSHYVVTKTIRDGRTSTLIANVDGKNRVEEIARMLGGRDLTSVTVRHAKEMLENVAAR
jgi:DNA repair protein RecN (Recombination protein N)